MARRIDVAGELAGKLVQALEAQRGADTYPLTLRHLAQLADPNASQPQVLKAANKKTFKDRAVMARSKTWEAPVAVVGDLALLAGSPTLLQFLLATCTKPTDQAFSVAQLKGKLTKKLQRPFQEAVSRQLDAGALPPTVGWIALSRSKRLFLWTELHANQRPPASIVAVPVLPPPVVPAPTPADFAHTFDDAFGRLDRANGAHNFVSLADLRRAVPVERAAFDAGLRELRRAGRYSLSAAEGRHGLDPAQQEAGILEDGTLLLYVSRRLP